MEEAVVGNGNVEKAKVYAYRYMKITVSIAVLMFFVLIGTAPLVISVYDVSDKVAHMAYINCMIFAVILLFQTHNYTGIVGILRSGGDNKFCLIINAISVWCVAIPLSFAVAYLTDLPIYFILVATGFEDFSKVFLVRRRVKTGKWANTLV